MLLQLTEMNDEARATHPIVVNTDEISSMRSYVFHSFRPPIGTQINCRNGEHLLVSESIDKIMSMIGSTR